MNIDSFPKIKEAALNIAYDNGKINRFDIEEDFLRRCNEIFKEYKDADLMTIESWLYILPNDVFETYCCGEQSEVEQIGKSAPHFTDELLNKIFEC